MIGAAPALRPVVRIIIPGERPQSWNHAYAGQHWKGRKAEVERVRLLVRSEIDPETDVLFTAPVDVTVMAYFDRRPLDADNIPAKLYIDALKGWLIADDDRRFVRSVRTVSEVDPAAPRVEIVVEPAR